MTYKELYLILAEINRKVDGEKTAKKKSFERIIELYEYNNGHRPI